MSATEHDVLESFSPVSCGVHLLNGVHGAHRINLPGAEDRKIGEANCAAIVMKAVQKPKVYQYQDVATANRYAHNYGCAMFCFSDADCYGAGLALVQYIRDHKLGHVTESPAVQNPNSGHDIRAWFWIPGDNLEAWAKERGLKMERTWHKPK